MEEGKDEDNEDKDKDKGEDKREPFKYTDDAIAFVIIFAYIFQEFHGVHAIPDWALIFVLAWAFGKGAAVMAKKFWKNVNQAHQETIRQIQEEQRETLRVVIEELTDEEEDKQREREEQKE